VLYRAIAEGRASLLLLLLLLPALQVKGSLPQLLAYLLQLQLPQLQQQPPGSAAASAYCQYMSWGKAGPVRGIFHLQQHDSANKHHIRACVGWSMSIRRVSDAR
jgi:hypothetical protein